MSQNVQLTPDTSNLVRKSESVRVIGDQLYLYIDTEIEKAGAM